MKHGLVLEIRGTEQRIVVYCCIRMLLIYIRSTMTINMYIITHRETQVSHFSSHMCCITVSFVPEQALHVAGVRV